MEPTEQMDAETYAERIYGPRLLLGQEYQDYAARMLLFDGIVLVNYQSQAAQYAFGENTMGLEIKFDRQFRRRGSLWIEVAERRHESQPYVPSGIRRVDNSWLFGIGDYIQFFLFTKRDLIAFAETLQEKDFVENRTKTSKAFLLDHEEREALKMRRFDWIVPTEWRPMEIRAMQHPATARPEHPSLF